MTKNLKNNTAELFFLLLNQNGKKDLHKGRPSYRRSL
jgi:hypothetical protein